MTTSYSLDYFKNNTALYQLAEKYDSADNKGNDNRILDGNEVSLFTKELKQHGISFDFTKIKDEQYLEENGDKYKDEAHKKQYRQDVINNFKDDYDIIAKENSDGTIAYHITPKVDVNISELRAELGIPAGVISKHNSGYDKHWGGPNGTHIDNTPMKGKTIKIPEGDLGKTNYFDRLCFWVKQLFS